MGSSIQTSNIDIENIKRDYEKAICRIVLYSVMESPLNYGIQKTIAILRGSYSAFMIDHKLNQSDINTYALLSNYSSAQLKDIIALLIRAGLLEGEPITAFQRPCLKVTEKGYSFICGEYDTDIEFIGNCIQHDLPQIDGNDTKLFQQLKSLRKSIASDMQLSAYVICTDRALFGLTQNKPTTKEELNNIHGIGDSFIEKYGRRFIDTINAYISNLHQNTDVIDHDKHNICTGSQMSKSPDGEPMSIQDEATNKIFEEELIKLLKEKLGVRESTILILRLGLGDSHGKTLSEIGEMQGVTRERIRQIEKKALRKLRHPSRNVHIPRDFNILEFRRDPSQYSTLYNTLMRRLELTAFTLSAESGQTQVSSLQSEAAPPTANSSLARAGLSWTAEEDDQLILSFDAGVSISELSSGHSRTWGAIKARLIKFGRITD